MVSDVVQRYYLGVTRYTTNTFLRARLGDALRQRDLAPQLYETAAEAAARLDPSRELDNHIRAASADPRTSNLRCCCIASHPPGNRFKVIIQIIARVASRLGR